MYWNKDEASSTIVVFPQLTITSLSHYYTLFVDVIYFTLFTNKNVNFSILKVKHQPYVQLRVNISNIASLQCFTKQLYHFWSNSEWVRII